MKKKVVIFLGIVTLMFIFTHMAFSKEVRYRSFTKKEIKKMHDTTAVLHTKFGDITLRFFPEVAPNHVNNFVELASKGFYDKTVFHRVIPDFMIQGGDPNSKDADKSSHGTGGAGHSLKAEFNKKSHKKGTLSMARSRHPDSAGSQFFICVADVPHLDGQYTVFGEVTDGIDVVDKIVSQQRDGNDNPLERIEMTVDINTPEEK
jgi:peptidyl-prolyl cis-trans isomerase B (cyclophilin B)